MKARKRTRVLRSDFPGDKEHRSTLRELEGVIANASLYAYLYTPTAPASRDEKRAAAIETAKAEDAEWTWKSDAEAPAAEEAAPAYIIEPGYEEQAHPMTARQEAVLTALHRELELTAPVDVIPPLEKLGIVVASFGEESRFSLNVDPEGFLELVRVRVRVAGETEWVSLGGSFGGVTYTRLKDAARAGRRVVTPEDNNILPA
jgi:hypothetical protein